jgi:hypothetical protein
MTYLVRSPGVCFVIVSTLSPQGQSTSAGFDLICAKGVGFAGAAFSSGGLVSARGALLVVSVILDSS